MTFFPIATQSPAEDITDSRKLLNMLRKKRKLLLWLGCVFGIILVLIAIGFGFLSRYINSEPAQKNIRQVVTRQSGELVTYQRAYLSIFPRPGLAFSQVVITIPQATAISAKFASIYPELLPLLIGSVKIAKLKFEEPDITINIPEKSEREKQSKPASFTENVANIDSVLASIRKAVPGLVCVLHRGKLLVREAGENTITAQNINARIALVPTGIEISFKGDVGRWGRMSARGKLYKAGNNILINDLSASIFDSSFTASAVISGFDQEIDSADVSINGNMGQETVRWVSKIFNLPPEHTLRAPLSISNAHLIWQAGSNLAVTGIAAIQNGPTFSLDLRKYAGVLAIKQLIIKDEDSHAAIAFTYGKKLVDFSFRGSLTEKALNRIFERTAFHHGWMKGDFRAHIQLDKPRASSAQGYLEGANLILPLGGSVPLIISRASLRADRKTLKIDSATISFGDDNFVLKGAVKAAGSGFSYDVDVSSDKINVDKIRQELAGENNPPEKPAGKNSVLKGIVRLTARSVTWGRYTASPVSADIELDRKGVRVALTDATVCGIKLPGNLRFGEKYIALDFKPKVSGAQLAPALDCIWGEDLRITGTADLKAEVNAQGKSDELVRSLQGKVDFRAKDGRIYRFPLLAKILSFLNVTELLRGKIPDLTAEGLDYNSIIIRGDLRNGIFVISEAIIDGTTMQLVGQGEIDVAKNGINLTVLVAPFKTVDYLVSKIPLVNYVLKDTLISIPLRITGKLDDPKIVILSPTAVGKGVLGIMKRTLFLPVKIIEPIIPRTKEKEQ